MNDADWQSAILDTMRRLLGSDRAAEVTATWNEHAARTRPEVTFLGPYSAGKSTLLRRLIIDGGAVVPDWLTISARRETFELNAIDVGDLTFTDAPGFAAGNELHDELAKDALALSDAFLLVVPPQLLTTNRELVGSILSGRYFFDEPRRGIDEVLIAVIAQADSMGIDPDDDVDGMRRLAERKRAELVAQLEGNAELPMGGLAVFCVAADPYEAQARQPDPQPSVFDPYRDWDGMDGLADALAALPTRHAALKRAAGIRYFCRVGVEIAAHARAVVDELEATASELRARRTQWSQQKTRVDAVVDAARSDLQSTLVSLSGTLSEELGVEQAEARSLIDERMTITLHRWAQRWDGEVDLVLGEAAAQIDDRLSRPRAIRTQEFLKSLAVDTDAPESPTSNSKVVSLLNDLKGEFQSIARKTLELCAGDSVEHLLAAKKTAKAQTDGAARLAAARAASEKAARAAHTLEAGLQIADGVMAVVTIIDRERRQQALDAQRRREGDEARDRIEQNALVASHDIVNGTAGAPGWRVRADAALDLLRERLGVAGDGMDIDELDHTVATQRQLIADLDRLVRESPHHRIGPAD